MPFDSSRTGGRCCQIEPDPCSKTASSDNARLILLVNKKLHVGAASNELWPGKVVICSVAQNHCVLRRMATELGVAIVKLATAILIATWKDNLFSRANLAPEDFATGKCGRNMLNKSSYKSEAPTRYVTRVVLTSECFYSQFTIGSAPHFGTLRLPRLASGANSHLPLTATATATSTINIGS